MVVREGAQQKQRLCIGVGMTNIGGMRLLTGMQIYTCLQYPILIPEAVWRLTCLYTIAGIPAPSPYERQEGALVYS